MSKQLKIENHSSEVLIVGGGFAGLAAAIKMKETEPELDVLVVDKATVGLSGGKANKGAGIISYMSKGQDPGPYIKYHSSEIGGYLNDQEFMYKLFSASTGAMEDLQRWGVKFARYPQNDNVVVFAIDPKARWSVSMLDHDMVENMRKTAMKLGVKMLDKIQITELLTTENKVTGATGFQVIDGGFHVFHAKAVVLACGSCDYMYTYMWSCARGDGIAAAYRAGAKLRGMEFANFYNLAIKGNRANIAGPGMLESVYNSKGERIIDKYGISADEPDVSIELFAAMHNEMEIGNGPFYHNPSDMHVFPAIAPRPLQEAFYAHSEGKEHEYTVDKSDMPEVTLNLLGEFSALKVDHDLKTTLEGLWAIGDTSYVGSGLSGACPAPPARIRGTGLMYAATSGILCAPSVVAYTKEIHGIAVNKEQIEAQKEALYAPLNREGVNPRELIYQLKCALAPSHYSIVKTEKHMKEALKEVDRIYEQAKTATTADGDFHMLGLCQDIINMSLCAKCYYEAALMRKESRGFHLRKDYPRRDDAKFLKWSIMELKDGKNVLSYEDVPIDNYEFRPGMIEAQDTSVEKADLSMEVSIDGEWEIVTNTPIGPEKSINSFRSEGEVLTGTITDKDGVHEIYDGTVHGNEFEFKVVLPLIFGETEFTMTGRIIGNSMNGEAAMHMGKSMFQGNKISE